MTLSPLAPLSTIQLAPLTREDLIQTIDAPQSPSHVAMADIDDTVLQAFEAAWLERINDHGHLMGKHEERIVKLQQEATNLKQTQDSVTHELKRQAAFLRQSRHDMETTFAARLQDTASQQKATQQKLQVHLDSVAATSTLAQATIPWTHFVTQLDHHVTAHTPVNDTTEHDWSTDIGIGQPSARALYLVQAHVEPSMTWDKKQQWSAAYRVDQVLLSRHIQMTESELERRQRLTVLHQTVGALVTEWTATDSDPLAPPSPLVTETGAVSSPPTVRNDPTAGPWIAPEQRLEP